MKRFLVFAARCCYPSGGMADLVACVDTGKEVVAAIEQACKAYPREDIVANVLDLSTSDVFTAYGNVYDEPFIDARDTTFTFRNDAKGGIVVDMERLA